MNVKVIGYVGYLLTWILYISSFIMLIDNSEFFILLVMLGFISHLISLCLMGKGSGIPALILLICIVIFAISSIWINLDGAIFYFIVIAILIVPTIYLFRIG